MIRKRRCLLVGGPKDGEWTEVEDGIQVVSRVVAAAEPVLVGTHPHKMQNVACVRYEYYRVHVGRDYDGHVFAESGLYGDDSWMKRLLEHYRPSPAARHADSLRHVLQGLYEEIANGAPIGSRMDLWARMDEARSVLLDIRKLEGSI